MSHQSSVTGQAEKSAIKKISMRLVPFVALMFFINFLDRTAISFAGPNGMTQDLGLTAAQFGLASGIFFIGYILLEIPSNLALHRYGARKWLARIMVSWGIVSLLFTCFQLHRALCTARTVRDCRSGIFSRRYFVFKPVGSVGLSQQDSVAVLFGSAFNDRDWRPAGRHAD